MGVTPWRFKSSPGHHDLAATIVSLCELYLAATITSLCELYLAATFRSLGELYLAAPIISLGEFFLAATFISLREPSRCFFNAICITPLVRTLHHPLALSLALLAVVTW